MNGKTLQLALAILTLLVIGAILAAISKNNYVLSTNDFVGAVMHSTPKQTTVKITFKPEPPEGMSIRTAEEMTRVLQGDVYVAEFGQPGKVYWQTDEDTYQRHARDVGGEHSTRWADRTLYFGEDSMTQFDRDITKITFKQREWHGSTLLFFPEAGGVWVIQFPEDWNPNGETRQLTATVY